MSFMPSLKLVSDEQIRQIHEKAIDMLDRFGIVVMEDRCRQELLDRGCKLINGDRVQLSHELIDEMIRSNKQSYEMESLFGQRLTIDINGHYSHTFGGAAGIVDLDGNYRLATGDDLVNAYCLNDQLDNVDMACAPVYPNDLDKRMCQYLEFVLPLKYSRKPVCGAALSHPGPAKYVAKLYELVTDGDPARPAPFMTSVSPQSPFIWTAEDIDCVRSVCGAGVPTMILAAPMAGLTSPLSTIGCLTQCHAEILAWGTWFYVCNPEAPRLYSSRCFFPNMRNCQLSIGLPENAIASAITAQLARYCGFLSDINGGYTTSCASDAQIGLEKMQNCFIPAAAGATIVTGPGAIAGGTIYSPVQHVIDDEVIGRVKKILQPVDLTDEDIYGMDAIEEVALNGSTFLQEPHTLEYLRELYVPSVSFNDTWAEWTTVAGQKEMRERAVEKARALMVGYERPELDPALAKAMDELTAAAEKELLA